MKMTTSVNLESEEIFGAETTTGTRYLAAKLGLIQHLAVEMGLDQVFGKDFKKQLLLAVSVKGFYEIERLPEICEQPGKVYLIIQAEGRIDRLEVIAKNQVRVYYSRDNQPIWNYEDCSGIKGERLVHHEHNASGKFVGGSSSLEPIVRILQGDVS